ncbi:DUF3775 domain-containing protein [Novosphingobium sp. FSW06-99]|uniref:DUF3775 domain-containing protein n=1 Tax=Novosphingobium sp. FSW06-99 TaxID=1739113 RepID=UPI000A81C7EA|nr:DUF3775 domain-containing protein [Novosphingobium sp. FSW06-99]
MPELTITPDTVLAIAQMARQFDVKVAESDPDSGSNPSDDMGVDALEFGPDDDLQRELVSVISDLNDDEQQDLVALILLGRGDLTLDEWSAARLTWNDIGRAHTPRFVTGIPLVSDYLEDGLSLLAD